jgi:hypothetical protein
MTSSNDVPPDLLETAHALEDHRPRMTDAEFARVKRRVAPRGPARTTGSTGGFMRSRLAIMAVLATGAVMSSGGAALGVSALSTDLTASSAQYGTSAAAAPSATGDSGVLGTSGSGGTTTAAPTGSSGVKGAATSSPSGKSGVAGESTSATTPTAVAQAPRQLESSQGDQLPFTGYAAIPLLLGGLALLAVGLVLRRSTRREPTQI